MSRSCQSTTFSSPTWALARSTRASPVIRSLTIGFCLCGIADEPFWPAANGSQRLAHLGALQVPHLGGEPVERRPGDGHRRQQRGVAVARDHLRGDVLALQPERGRARTSSTRGSQLAYVPTAPDSLPTRDALEGGGQPLAVAAQLRHPAQQLQAEGGRLGVDAVRAADGRRVPVLLGPDQHGPLARRRAPASSSSPASRSCSASAVSTTSDDVSP